MNIRQLSLVVILISILTICVSADELKKIEDITYQCVSGQYVKNENNVFLKDTFNVIFKVTNEYISGRPRKVAYVYTDINGLNRYLQIGGLFYMQMVGIDISKSTAVLIKIENEVVSGLLANIPKYGETTFPLVDCIPKKY